MSASNNPRGTPSVQNALLLALQELKGVPSYGRREVLIVYGSISTSDPGDLLHDTIPELVKHKVHCSVVGLSAGEVHVLRALADQTGGTCRVALNTHQPPQRDDRLEAADDELHAAAPF